MNNFLYSSHNSSLSYHHNAIWIIKGMKGEPCGSGFVYSMHAHIW